MKSSLDKIISENSDYFNRSEPADGHFERFEAKLDKEFGKKRKLNFRIVWQVAAAIAFIFIALNQAVIYFSPKEEKTISLASVSPEYGEMENFYVTAINTSLTNWNALKKEGALTSEETELLENELKEFDDTFKSLQEELKANPDDERVINAMIEYYQSKLDVITIVLENMKEVKRIKEINHETEI